MRRLASLALITILAAVVPAAAAHAAPVTPTLTMGQTSVSPGSQKSLPLTYRSLAADGSQLPFDLVLDITAARDFVTVGLLQATCVTTATTVTCPTRGGEASTWVTATAKPDAPVGTSVRIPGRIVVGGRTVASATGTITIAEEVSLTPVQAQDATEIPTGTTAGLAAGLRNSGDRPITGVVLRLQTAVGMETAGYRNCSPIEGRGAVMPTAGAACLFEGELAPGQEYRLATPWRLTATDAVWAPSQWLSSFTWYTAQDWIDQGHALPGGGSEPELRLSPAPGAVTRAVPQTEHDPNANPDNNLNEWNLSVTGRNNSTFTVRGDTTSGRVGQTADVRVSVRNNGPARMEGWGNAFAAYLTVTVRPPAGTTVVKHSKLCEPFNVDYPTPGVPWPDGADFNDGNFYCWTGMFEGLPYLPGKTVDFDFTLRIDKPGALRGTVRTVLVPSGAPQVRQQADIIVTATGPAGGGSGDGDGGGDGGGEGGGLPITGSNTTVVALVGLALLIAGAVTRVATRRR